ncbi:MAG TPA: PEP-CTERM sorting domain-containing protein, partial [Bryobacteraceae bacterium]|nr:PEP-CTERM sorting domain-containing protein [Bryobacteraceae bacterium]
GFNSSDLSFTASQIQVNWAGLSFSTSTEVVLDVTTSSVPEPATFALIGSALLLLGASRWRRQRR